MDALVDHARLLQGNVFLAAEHVERADRRRQVLIAKDEGSGGLHHARDIERLRHAPATGDEGLDRIAALYDDQIDRIPLRARGIVGAAGGCGEQCFKPARSTSAGCRPG